MENDLNYLSVIFFIFIFAVAGYRYDQYVLKNNFILQTNTACDPKAENCFMVDCTPGDIECDSSPYEKVTVNAGEAPPCLSEHSCQDFSCDLQKSCAIQYCSADTLSDGEACTGPAAGK